MRTARTDCTQARKESMPVPNTLNIETVAFAACGVMHAIHDLSEEPLKAIGKHTSEGYARAIGKRIYRHLLDGSGSRHAVRLVCSTLVQETAAGSNKISEGLSNETKGQHSRTSFASPFTHRRVGQVVDSTTVTHDLKSHHQKDAMHVLKLLESAGYSGGCLCSPAEDQPAEWARAFAKELGSQYMLPAMFAAGVRLFEDIQYHVYNERANFPVAQAKGLIADAAADPATLFALVAPRRLAAIMREQMDQRPARNAGTAYWNADAQLRGCVKPADGVLLAELLAYRERADLNALSVSGERKRLPIEDGVPVDGEPDRRYDSDKDNSSLRTDFETWLTSAARAAAFDGDKQLALWLLTQIVDNRFRPPKVLGKTKNKKVVKKTNKTGIRVKNLSDPELEKLVKLYEADHQCGASKSPSHDQICAAFHTIGRYTISRLRDGE